MRYVGLTERWAYVGLKDQHIGPHLPYIVVPARIRQ